MCDWADLEAELAGLTDARNLPGGIVPPRKPSELEREAACLRKRRYRAKQRAKRRTE